MTTARTMPAHRPVVLTEEEWATASAVAVAEAMADPDAKYAAPGSVARLEATGDAVLTILWRLKAELDFLRKKYVDLPGWLVVDDDAREDALRQRDALDRRVEKVEAAIAALQWVRDSSFDGFED